jgi:hypothetical protein
VSDASAGVGDGVSGAFSHHPRKPSEEATSKSVACEPPRSPKARVRSPAMRPVVSSTDSSDDPPAICRNHTRYTEPPAWPLWHSTMRSRSPSPSTSTPHPSVALPQALSR